MPASAAARPLATAVAGVFLPEVAAASVAVANPGSEIDPLPIVGTYVDRESLQVREVRAHDGVLGLRTSLDAATDRDLVQVDAHTFSVKGTTIQIRLAPGSGSSPSPQLLEKQGDASEQVFERFVPVTDAATPLQEYAGRYESESDEIATDMELVVREGRLVVATHGRAGARRLRPVIADGFEGGGMGFRFERDGRGQIAGFALSANRIRGIRWKRR